MSLMAANEESDPSAILNGFWVTLFYLPQFVLIENKTRDSHGQAI